MLTSLAILFLSGLALAALARALHLPRLVGMLLAGILCGPYVLNLLDDSLLSISADLRQMALVIILIKAGLALKLSDLKAVGRPSLLLSFLPACFEILGVLLFAPAFLGLSLLEAALLGAVLAAVSPAVVVPRMVELMEEKRGTDKSIPQMLLAGSSLDDVFVIILFYSFLSLLQGQGLSLIDFLSIPLSIVLGLLFGWLMGVLLAKFYDAFDQSGYLGDVTKLLLLLSVSFLFLEGEDWLKESFTITYSGLLAVMACSMALAAREKETITLSLQTQCTSLWQGAEVLLFCLVGAAVDIRYTLQAGAGAIVVILGALAIRSIGTWCCLLGTNLNSREKLYCILAYLPKATVQAAIGGVALSLGLSCGNLILSVAVLSILITAPLGAFAMDLGAPRLLSLSQSQSR